MTTLISDIECNGFYNEATIVWCIVSKDIDTGHIYTSVHNGTGNMQMDEHLELLASAEKVVFHNGFGYDRPVLKKLHGLDLRVNQVEDTFVLSSLFYPDRQIPKGCSKGAHSLQAWGIRFNLYKGDHTEFDKYSPAMLDYCVRDVEITEKVYERLLKDRREHDWEKAIKLEYLMASIQSEQEIHGVVFDHEKAYGLVEELTEEIVKIEEEVLPQIPSKPKQVGVTVAKPFKLDGSYSKMVTDWYPELGGINMLGVSGQFCRVEWPTINLNSDTQVKAYLLSQGWIPTEWNYKKDKAGKIVKVNGEPVKTSPKLTEDSYASVKGDIPRLVARRNILVHRRRQVFNITKQGELKGWLNLVRPDGRIEAQGVPQATNTGRYRHKIVVNVPKAMDKVVYGRQMRELFTVPEGRVLVGTDADALEARMEAHYCYDFEGGHEYAHELIDGDVHSKNAQVFGTDRDGAKSPKYALTYGCQAPTLADTLGCSKERAQLLLDNFWASNTALAGFREAVEAEYRSNGKTVLKDMGHYVRKETVGGWIEGLDGRKIFIRSPHACVNAKFQSGGSIVVKMATIFMNKWIKEQGLDAHQVIHMHDEIQFDCAVKDVERLKTICKRAWVEAGKYFNLNVPITGDAQVGKCWAETH